MKKKNLGLVIVIILGLLFNSISSKAENFKIGNVDWSLGGSIRIDAEWQKTDYGDDVTDGKNTDRDRFTLQNPGDSNVWLSAKFEKMEAMVEVGLDKDSNLYSRHLYLNYNINNENSLLIGRTWTILSEDSPTQYLWLDNCLFGAGDLTTSRHEQIRFSRVIDNMTIRIALEDNRILKDDNTGGDDIFGLNSAGKYKVNDLYPALYASFSYSDFGLTLNPSGFIQSYKLEANGKDFKDVDVTSYAGALNASYKNDLICISGEIWFGQNLYFYLTDIRPSNPDDPAIGASTIMAKQFADNNNKLKDIDSAGGWIQLAITKDPYIFRIGSGYQESDTGLESSNSESKVSTWGTFINLSYTVFKNFSITPEIAYYDYGKDADKNRFGNNKSFLGYDIFYGAHFQYDF